jgi:hypothetical protein
MNDAQLHDFYESFVERLRCEGVVCAITSGLACVHYDLAETTKDCDLLCHPKAFDQLLKTLEATEVDGLRCRYRGNLSPPLDERWHHGGWTSHFHWGEGPETIKLDVFGRALRASTTWERELAGLYAGPHIVAEMKRTNREKDWPFITGLGVKLVRAGDPRGWLHVFDHEALLDLLGKCSPPEEIAARRPALELALKGDPKTAGALNAEQRLWEELDRLRVRIYERALRPYMVAVRKAGSSQLQTLREDHELRVRCAADKLAIRPLDDYGIDRHIREAKEGLVARGVLPHEALDWLPDITENFNYLKP